MKKVILKNMNIYKLHRNDKADHKNGRPAILIKYKTKTALIWWGTHKRENNSDEKPLTIKLNKTNTYFYYKGIEKINNYSIRDDWINYQTNNIYELNDLEQKELIKTFTRFTNQKDPYQRNSLLILEKEMLRKENEQLKKENRLLKQKEKEVLLKDQELEDEYEYQ